MGDKLGSTRQLPAATSAECNEVTRMVLRSILECERSSITLNPQSMCASADCTSADRTGEYDSTENLGTSRPVSPRRATRQNLTTSLLLLLPSPLPPSGAHGLPALRQYRHWLGIWVPCTMAAAESPPRFPAGLAVCVGAACDGPVSSLRAARRRGARAPSAEAQGRKQRRGSCGFAGRSGTGSHRCEHAPAREAPCERFPCVGRRRAQRYCGNQHRCAGAQKRLSQ